jgi:Ferredoxin-like domain in Api92-like protein
MPNWCNNRLTVKGETEEVQRFKQSAVGHNPWDSPLPDENPSPFNFHSLVPVPETVLREGYVNEGYDWEIANWGCRSGDCDAGLVEDKGDELLYGFDTVWNPPTAFLRQLGKLWPDLMFQLEYEEPGAGFKGICQVRGHHYDDQRSQT